MSRGLDSGLTAQLGADTVYPAFWFEGDFGGSVVRVWTGIGTSNWASLTWTGVGTLAGFSAVEETTEFSPKSVSVSLSGVSSANIALVLAAAKQGRQATIYFGLLNAAGTLVADPYRLFTGWLDVPTINDAGETATISITYEAKSIVLERAQGRRYTHEDQQIDYAGDLGFEYVAGLQDQIITWGNTRSGPTTAASTPVVVSAVDNIGGGL